MTAFERLGRAVGRHRRKLAAVGALSLAGCNQSGDEAAGDDTTSAGSADDDGSPDSDTTMSPTPMPDTGAAPTPTPTPAPTTQPPPSTDTPGDGDSTTQATATPTRDCTESRIQELQEEANALREERGALQFEAERHRWNREGMQALVDQLSDGFPQSTLDAVQAVGDQVSESVVYVESDLGAGTGWVAADGAIVTNAHVVKSYTGEPADSYRGYTVDGTQFDLEIDAHVAGNQPDLALLTTDDVDLPALSIGDEHSLAQGDPVVQVGHPGGYGNWVVTLGKYLRREEVLQADGAYHDVETLVPGLQGVSGSPLVDLDGDVVGCTWGAHDPIMRMYLDPAAVAPDVVYDRPLAPIQVSEHTAATTVADYLGRWGV